MDMLNADLHMRNNVKLKYEPKRPKAASNNEDAAFHFIAYVPIDDTVWKLDGLERQPQKLGITDLALDYWRQMLTRRH